MNRKTVICLTELDELQRHCYSAMIVDLTDRLYTLISDFTELDIRDYVIDISTLGGYEAQYHLGDEYLPDTLGLSLQNRYVSRSDAGVTRKTVYAERVESDRYYAVIGFSSYSDYAKWCCKQLYKSQLPPLNISDSSD